MSIMDSLDMEHREADEGFVAPRGHTGETATLEVGSWNTTCSACRRGTRMDARTHDWIIGYGPQGPGCGAEFTAVMSVYGDESVATIRPDLEFLGWAA